MNKFEKISLASIVGFTILGTTVFGATGKVFDTSEGLILRGEASKSGEILGTIPNDKEVEILESLDEWYKVKVDGKEGFLFAEYVKVEEDVIENPVNEENTNSNTTKQETKVYKMPLITSTVVGTIPANSKLNIEKTLNDWLYVSYENGNGWVRAYNYNSEVVETKQPETPAEQEEVEKPEENIETETEETTEVSAPVENTELSFTKGYINEESVNVRKEANKSSEIVTTLILNTGVTITAQTEEWYKVTYGDYTGYIYKPLISKTPTVTNRGNETREPEEEIEPEISEENVEQNNSDIESVPTTSSAGEKIVSFAKQYLGYDYVYGGTTPSGFDCSGFVYYVFKSCGYSISRSLTYQATTGTAVSKSELRMGDVIFFDNTSDGSLGHVGIYIGNGTFIHAANSRRGVVTDTINSGYYNTYYYSARRIAY